MIDFYSPFKKIDVTIEMFYCEREQRNSDLWQFGLIYLDIIQGMVDCLSFQLWINTFFFEKHIYIIYSVAEVINNI